MVNCCCNATEITDEEIAYKILQGKYNVLEIISFLRSKD